MADTSASVSPFNFGDHAVRVVMLNGNVWFVATDVAESLGYRNAPDASRHLDDDEKGTQIVRTPGGDQKLTIINESGLYALVLRSRKPEARKFAKWVTSEVLPSIRKTGTYTQPATLSPDQKQNLRELVELVSATGKQKHGETWARLQRKFKVNSYHELPAAKFGEACEYLRSKMSQEDIGGLVQKHFTQQIELLNVKKQFELDYGEGRSLHFTPNQQLAINQKAFDMAKEVFELSVQHITQQVYGQTPGNLNGSVTDAQVKKGVDRTTLSSALLGKYAQDLYCISATAAMAVTIAKQTKMKLDKELSRIGFAGLTEPSAL